MMSKQMILILGGARSGKSTHAERLATDIGGDNVLYVATAQALDEDMRARIATHQAARPARWRTLEAPLLTTAAHAPEIACASVIVLDCVTLLASNAILALGDDCNSEAAEAAVAREIGALLRSYSKGTASWVVVSNEVGLGLVPPYPLGRIYRDALGRANQRLAAAANRVLLMVAGLAITVK